MLPIKLRSERCANDLNHFQLKVPSGTFSIAEIGLSGLSTNQVKQSASLAVLVCSIENVTFRFEVDDGRNHF